jgi:spermidine/putrescine transport system substrate-binding protein
MLRTVLGGFLRHPARLLALIACLPILFVGGCSQSKENAPSELRVLAWVGYDEPEIIEPFQTEFKVKVSTETFSGADRMFAKITSSPDAYDLVVIDPEYIEKLYKVGLLSPLDPKDFDFSHYIPALQYFPLCSIDGKLYTVLVRFGVNGLVYNTTKLSPDEVTSYRVLWSPKLKGRVGIWDWYLPNMGVLSLASGFSDPYHLDRSQTSTLNKTLASLRPQVRAVMGTFAEVNAAFARGDIWAVPALGEHTAAVLAEQGQPIAWTIPKEGAIMWIETLGIPQKSKNRKAAIDYIRYIQRPDVQAKLTWRRAYRSNIPNVDGIALLTAQQKDLLHVHDGAEADALVRKLQVRRLPTNSSGDSIETVWQTEWQNFKASSKR